MSLLDKFLRGFVTEDDGEVGILFRDEEGRVIYRDPEGVEAEVNAGGGSQPVTVVGNGLRKNWDLGDLKGNQTVLVDASPQAWTPATEYVTWDATTAWIVEAGARVHPTADDSLNFVAAYRARGESGSSEPDWGSPNTEQGGTWVLDNDIAWGPVADFAGSWEATTVYGGGVCILVGGKCFQSSSGTSGGSEPDFASAPNYGDSVNDNDITWLNLGSLVVWQANHEYSIELSSDKTVPVFDKVVPASLTGQVWVFQHQLHGGGSSGSTEPDWNGDSGSHLYTVDGDILWHEDTDNGAEGMFGPGPTAAVTGIVAPSGPAVVEIVNLSPATSIRLEDTAEVANDFLSASFNDSAVSDSENALDFDDQKFDIGPGQSKVIGYFDGRWQLVTAV